MKTIEKYTKLPDQSNVVTNRVMYKYGKYKIIVLEECTTCPHYELITHSVAPYSFCNKYHLGFGGTEPEYYYQKRIRCRKGD